MTRCFLVLYILPAAFLLLLPDPCLGQARMLTVEQAVAGAIANNVGVLAERANVPVAEATVITARLKPNPVLSLGADHLDVLGTRNNTLNNAGPNEVNARIDFLIERANKREYRVETA